MTDYHATLADVTLAAKGLAIIPGAIGGVILAAGDTPVLVGGGSIIVGLCALFLRQFFQNQAQTWLIAKERKSDAEEWRNRYHYAAWENDKLRFRLGERDDPGPYVPRPDFDHPVSLDKEA